MQFYRPLRLAAILAVFAAALAAAPSASASAWGCAFGNPNYGPPQYCVYISGGGTWVNSVTGNWGGGTEIGDWYITAEFYTRSWYRYALYKGPYHKGSSTGGGDVIPINRHMRTGHMCSALNYVSAFTKNWRSMRVCHRVNQ